MDRYCILGLKTALYIRRPEHYAKQYAHIIGLCSVTHCTIRLTAAATWRSLHDLSAVCDPLQSPLTAVPVGKDLRLNRCCVSTQRACVCSV